MHIRKTAQSGFSLIELLIAVVILAVGLLGLAELQITAMKANGQSETLIAANSLAQRAIEDILHWSENDSRITTTDTDLEWGLNIELPGAGAYDVTYDVNVDYLGVTGVTQVIVTVKSTTAVSNVLGNRERMVTMSTLKRGF